MSDRYEAQVLAALAATGVRPPAAYLWFGHRFAVASGDSLAGAIQQRLLADFQPFGAPRPARHRPAVQSADGGAFARALSQANCGRGSWQTGWRVAAVEEDAITVALRQADLLTAPFAIADELVTLTSSIGIALAVPGEINAAELIHRADTAMYDAKSDGPGRYCLHAQAASPAPF